MDVFEIDPTRCGTYHLNCSTATDAFELSLQTFSKRLQHRSASSSAYVRACTAFPLKSFARFYELELLAELRLKWALATEASLRHSLFLPPTIVNRKRRA
ncbi:hypothetical protein [Variovorax sp. RCC_210]|uniref:hypothetical protein n=1 Tax=Variovorax sp. RCC_210 TaxID=3239217 RepID=UPI00352623AF